MPTEIPVEVTGPPGGKNFQQSQRSPFPRRTEDALVGNINDRLGILASLMDAFGAGDALFQNIAARKDPTIPALLNIASGNLANFQNQGLDANAFLSGDINAGIPDLQQASVGAGTGSPTDIPIQRAGINPIIESLFSNLIAPSFIDQLQGTTEALFALQSPLQGPLPERIVPAQPFRPAPQLTGTSFFDIMNSFGQGNQAAAPQGNQGTFVDVDALFANDPNAQLGVLDDGITHVPKTGNFQLQEGEAVIPRQLNPFASAPQGTSFAPPPPPPAPAPVPQAPSMPAAPPASLTGGAPQGVGGVQDLFNRLLQQFPGAGSILPQLQQQQTQSTVTRPPPQPPFIPGQTITESIENVPGPFGIPSPPGTSPDAPVPEEPFLPPDPITPPLPVPEQTLNPLQQAIQNTLALQGGPITPEIFTAQERMLKDAIDRRVFSQQTGVRERLGARGIGGGGLSEQLQLQSQLGGINALTQGLNQLQLGSANQNFQGGLAASNLLSNQALGAGQFGLQQAQVQQGLATSLFESLLRAIQQSQANPGDVFANTSTVQVL